MKYITFRFFTAVTTFLIGIGFVAFWVLSRPLPTVSLPQPLPKCASESGEEITPSRLEIAERIKILTVFQEIPFEQANGVDESYRLIRFPAFDAPTVVRIWRLGEKFTITTKRLSGKGGYEIGTLKTEYTRSLTAEEWNSFVDVVNDKCFWNAPSAVKEVPMMDGASWTFEGLKNGRYHFVHRISPHNQMIGIFRNLFGLTRVKTEHEDYFPIEMSIN